ncbi:hypothetical protein CRUP_017545, partial [Coryphaenoides rupestris]
MSPHLLILSRLPAAYGSASWAALLYQPTAVGWGRPKPGSRRWLHMKTADRTSSGPGASWRPSKGPVFRRAPVYGDRLAIVDGDDGGGRHTYAQLYGRSRGLARQISSALLGCGPQAGGGDLQGQRVAFLCGNDASYTVAQWAVWMCGGVAVPLYHKHPVVELEYIISDSQSALLLAGHPYAAHLEPLAQQLGLPCLTLPASTATSDLGLPQRASETPETEHDEWDADWDQRPAMIIYTSGTTGRPKGGPGLGVGRGPSMMSSYTPCHWHHVHGIVNKLLCPLWAGATCVMLSDFQPHKLILHYQQHLTQPNVRDYIRAVCKEHIRLMVSGSAALPVPVLQRWEEISGHTLLERYGMTEIGMALSNPLLGARTP